MDAYVGVEGKKSDREEDLYVADVMFNKNQI